MSVYRKGSTGVGVIALQKALTAAGFSAIADGIFGEATEAQVIAFQKSKGLTADGIAGPATLKALEVKPTNYIMGVDTSHWEAKFDFEKGVKDGVVFMMTKASESRSVDSTCATLCIRATEAGIKYKGAYHFFHAGVPVDDQVGVYLRQIRNIVLEMPPILDLEETSVDSRTPAQVKDAAIDWLTKVGAQTGSIPMLYIDMNMINILGITKDVRFKKYPLWVARYSKNEPTVEWTFWQFTDGDINGPGEGLDTNYFHGTERDLKNFLGIA